MAKSRARRRFKALDALPTGKYIPPVKKLALELEIKVDQEALLRLEPSLEWAVEQGVLNEQEAVALAAEEVLNGITVTTRKL